MHPFFDELRNESTTLPNGNALPDLFNFTNEELMQCDPQKVSLLIPDWYRNRMQAQERQEQRNSQQSLPQSMQGL